VFRICVLHSMSANRHSRLPAPSNIVEVWPLDDTQKSEKGSEPDIWQHRMNVAEVPLGGIETFKLRILGLPSGM
jgi:hypothetical protein